MSRESLFSKKKKKKKKKGRFEEIIVAPGDGHPDPSYTVGPILTTTIRIHFRVILERLNINVTLLTIFENVSILSWNATGNY